MLHLGAANLKKTAADSSFVAAFCYESIYPIIFFRENVKVERIFWKEVNSVFGRRTQMMFMKLQETHMKNFHRQYPKTISQNLIIAKNF